TEKPDPQALLLQTLAKAELEDAIVRLIYRVTASQLAAIDLNPLREALSVTHSYTIQPELVNPTAAPRLPELGEGQDLSPLDALEAYVASRSELADIATDLLEAAQVLWLGEAEPRSGQRKAAELAKTTVQETGDRYGVETAGTDASDKTQLRLL
ncbi:MAG: DNA double-strand break repair protein Mre11, partial [Prochlorothrix sp.]